MHFHSRYPISMKIPFSVEADCYVRLLQHNFDVRIHLLIYIWEGVYSHETCVYTDS